MNKADARFISILRDFVSETNTEKKSSDTEEVWMKIMELAQIHGVQGIIWAQCGHFIGEISKEIADSLHIGFQSEIFYSVCRDTDLALVSKALSKADIPFIIMKGMSIKKYYPVTLLRTMADIDLVIKKKDRRKSDETLLEMGFKREIGNQAVWVYDRDVIEYELHDSMMYDTLSNGFDYQDYFLHVWDHSIPSADDTTSWEVDKNFHFIFLLVHVAKHILNSGMGIRAFLDLALMAKNADLDLSLIRKEIDGIQLTEFAKTCSSLCYRWFDQTILDTDTEMSDEFFDKVTDHILRDGIFGKNQPENEIGTTTKRISSNSGGYWVSALKILFTKILPGYDDMRIKPQYSFLDGKPWLMPAAWIYRWGYCIKNKKEYGVEELTKYYRKKNEIEDRMSYYREWGL